MITSRYVYERSVLRDIASVFANTRAHLPHSHYSSIDRLILDLADALYDNDPTFDVEDFMSRARAYTDRTPLPAFEPDTNPQHQLENHHV